MASESNHPPSSPMLARSASPVGAGAASGTARESKPLLPPDACPDAIVDEILALLGEERFRSARRLAEEAIARFPEHRRVRNAWTIFDTRGKARVTSGGPEPDTDEEFEWLRHPPEWARGKWVALVGREAVAAADTLAEVLETLRARTFPKRPLVHRVD